MKAFVCHTIASDLSGLALCDVEPPSPRSGEVRIKVEHASVNFPDLLMCQGLYQYKPQPPFIPGTNISGEIDALGENATRFQMGDRVVATSRLGGFAEHLVVAEDQVLRAPRALNSAQAAAYPTAYLTAYVSLVRRARLAPGETVLVHGASGGVGLATVDLAKLLGANVIATTGSQWKLEELKAFGADHVLASQKFAPAVKALTDGKGADVIFDPVGGEVFDESTHCIAFDGRLLVVGFTSGRFATLKSNIALIKGFSVVGVRAGEYGRRFPDKGRENQQAIWALAEEGKIKPYVHRELPLAEVGEAFELLRRRAVIGKVVIRCDQNPSTSRD